MRNSQASTHLGLAGLMIGAFAVAEVAIAAPKKSSGMSASSSGSSGKDVDRSFLVSLPVIADRTQARVHLEYNIAKAAGLALEVASLGEVEELSEKEVNDTGNSMKVHGAQASLLLSRYTEPARLGGFFWSLGAGYRQYTADWKRRPDDKSTALQLESVDDNGYMYHRVQGSGVTGHGRVGYRWVASEWPVAIGGHLGLRHMNSKVKDVEVDAEKQRELNLEYSPINDAERKTLSNRMMTTPDITVDIGMIF